MATVNPNTPNPSQALITPGHPYAVTSGSGIAGNKAVEVTPTTTAVVAAQAQHPAGKSGSVNH